MWYSITLAAGVILLVIAVFCFRNSLSFLSRGERTTATVTSIERIEGSDGPTYKPVFKFSTLDNQEVTYRPDFSSYPSAWSEGETATIVYEPGNPAKAKLLTYFGAFGLSVVLAAIAMPFLVLGGGYYALQHWLR